MRRLISTLIITSLTLTVFYGNNCTRLEKVTLGETVAGNPFVELQFIPFNGRSVENLELCVSSLQFKQPESGVSTFPLEAGERTISSRGSPLGSGKMGGGVFVEAELEISDRCGINKSIQFTNSSGTRVSQATMKLKFSGYAQVGLTRTTIGFDLQRLIDAFDGVTDDLSIPPTIQSTAGRFSSTGEITPDGRPVCADWVHALHTTTGPDGLIYPTWHPQIDPVYGCVFGHEHGSDPRSFIGFTGMPAFGYAAATAGISQSHFGYKVYVINDDGRGKAWMVTVHQESSGPERALPASRYHEVSLYMVDTTPARTLLARFFVMADFGPPASLCGTLPAGAYRAVPRIDCANTYESWITSIDIGGGIFRAMPTFGILNSTTRVDPADLTRLLAQPSGVCGNDPFGWNTNCKGDVRQVVAPGWVLANSGASDTVVTDAFGVPSASGIVQTVRRGVSVDESGERTGSSVVYVMDDITGGGVFKRQDTSISGLSVGFEIGPFTVRWKN